MKSGLRKLIYVPTQEIWESIVEQAKMEGRSASNYLINLHKVNRQKTVVYIDQPEQSEAPKSTYFKPHPKSGKK